MEVSVLDGDGQVVKHKTIKQSDLTADCWPVQFWGLSACDGCEFLGKRDCGGKSIRKAMLAGERPATGL